MSRKASIMPIVRYLATRSGPLSTPIPVCGGFARTGHDDPRPDIQFHFATLSADMAGAKPHPWSGCTFSVCQLRPESRGRVKVSPEQPRSRSLRYTPRVRRGFRDGVGCPRRAGVSTLSRIFFFESDQFKMSPSGWHIHPHDLFDQ